MDAHSDSLPQTQPASPPESPPELPRDAKPQGAFSALLADKDLTHLEIVMRRSLSCDLGGPLLPASYWRERIKTITRQVHLSPTQLQAAHRLYLYIDLFEIAEREAQLASEKERASRTAARNVG